MPQNGFKDQRLLWVRKPGLKRGSRARLALIFMRFHHRSKKAKSSQATLLDVPQ